ncbi:hypothetical protein HJFPF1_06808 [Paramyrothecium foliicola]|nr:hypothetical protein HJFPF1_06808 [Paramyrothecium foliicola]
MPHKHKRKRGDDSEYDLPPSQRARSLPVGKARVNTDRPKKADKRRKKQDDDAPRAFKRLMAVARGRKIRSGLDDGKPEKSEKKAPTETSSEFPRIRPGEDLRSFATRVDAELPVSGLTKKTVVKDGKDEQGFKVFRTRKERKMHKLYDQWRAEDQKIKDKREEEQDLAAERELDDEAAGITAVMDQIQASAGKGKKARRKAQDDDDPWAELKRKRAEAKVRLHDVAQAPPELNKSTARQLKVAGAAVNVENVPKSAGSLRRREELQVARNDVVEAYRKIKEHEQAKLDALKAKSR